MTQTPNQQMMQFPNPPTGRGPGQIAALVGQYVISMAKIVFWLVVGMAVLATGFVALRAIWWLLKLILGAVGGL